MAMVKFSDIEEFLHELRLDASKVEGKLVRLTFRHRAAGTPPFRGLAVIATAIVGPHLVSLEDDCGTFLPDTKEADAVKERGTAKFRQIEDGARDIGLDVRNGTFTLT